MKLKNLFFILIGIAFIFSSCKHDEDHLGKKKLEEIQVWTFAMATTQSGIWHISMPAIDENDNIYVEDIDNWANNDDRIYCLTKDGEKKWEFNTNGYFKSRIIYKDQKVYFVVHNKAEVKEYLYCLDATSGQELWRFRFHPSSEIYSTPIALNDKGIYVASADTLHKIDYNGNQVYGVYIYANLFHSINCVDDYVYVSASRSNNHSAYLYKYQDDGFGVLKIWELEFSGESCTTADIAIDDDRNAYFFTSSNLYCIAPDGSIKWKQGDTHLNVRNSTDYASASITDSGYVLAGSGNLCKFDSKGGLVWKHEYSDIPDIDVYFAPAIGKNKYYYYVEGIKTASDVGIRVFNPNDGSYYWYSLEPRGEQNLAIMHNGNVVFSREGVVYCLKTESNGLDTDAQYPKFYYDYGNTGYKK